MPMFSLDFGYRKTSDSSAKASQSMDSLQGSLKDQFGQPYYRSVVEARGRQDFGELELELWDSRYNMFWDYKHSKWSGFCKPSCIPISVVTVLISLVVVLSLLDQRWEDLRKEEILLQKTELLQCQESCRMTVVESIPEGLTFNSTQTHLSTYDAWVELLSLAEHDIDIGAMYWSLQGKEVDHPTAAQGKDVFRRIMEIGLKSRVKIRIAQNIDTPSFPNFDTKDLEDAGAAEVRRVNFTRLLGAGILHTKIWIVDNKHAYVGSANIDWRSLTQVKELGILVTNCSCFSKDLKKIFNVYWELGQNNSKIPSQWPSSFDTHFGKGNPMSIALNGTPYDTYISSSPPSFCPNGRTTDIDSILDVIDNSTQFVHIAVMDYFPATVFTQKPKYWPNIDDRLRSAAVDRKVAIKLLMSKWKQTDASAYHFLNSLQVLNKVYAHVDIKIKLFEVPSTPDQAKIPYARVNHNKYMVTEEAAYIGTSNWSGDYFISTGGVGVIIVPRDNSNMTQSEGDVREQIKDIFDRDWNSPYAFDLEYFLTTCTTGDCEHE